MQHEKCKSCCLSLSLFTSLCFCSFMYVCFDVRIYICISPFFLVVSSSSSAGDSFVDLGFTVMLHLCFPLRRKAIQSYPVPPKIRHFNRRWSSSRTNSYNRQYWRVVMNENYSRPSFWVSDFRHRHLMRTGTDFQGQVPASPMPGLYQGFSDVHKILANHPKPQRESRHLPVLPMTPRVVFEHMNEKKIDTAKKMRSDRRKVEQLKTLEFWGWYMKLQRVRGRWCREQGVSSRGVYGPAVDAAELWG